MLKIINHKKLEQKLYKVDGKSYMITRMDEHREYYRMWINPIEHTSNGNPVASIHGSFLLRLGRKSEYTKYAKMECYPITTSTSSEPVYVKDSVNHIDNFIEALRQTTDYFLKHRKLN
jgi:hypothetical protein